MGKIFKRAAITLMSIIMSNIGMAVPASTIASKPSSTQNLQNIMEALGNDKDLTSFAKVLQQTELDKILRDPTHHYTVFAPVNYAIDVYPREIWNALLANKVAMMKTLSYHVLPVSISPNELENGSTAKTLQGSIIYLTNNTLGIYVNSQAKAVKPAIAASNGYIYVIDSVLIPPPNKISK